MREEMQRLHDSLPLRQLLEHYAQRSADDRTVWQDRLMALDGVPAAELTRLHGELLSFEWLEMNVGVTTGAASGAPGCYRVTVAGLRAWKRAQGGLWVEEEDTAAPTPTRPFPRRKKRGERAAATVPGAAGAGGDQPLADGSEPPGLANARTPEPSAN